MINRIVLLPDPLMEMVIEKKQARIDVADSPSIHGAIERRGKQRINERFPISIRGKDKSGAAFELQTVTDNISATGLYVRLNKPLEWGTKLFMVVQLSREQEEASGVRIAVRGEVRRTERLSLGCYGIGVRFSSHRFL